MLCESAFQKPNYKRSTYSGSILTSPAAGGTAQSLIQCLEHGARLGVDLCMQCQANQARGCSFAGKVAAQTFTQALVQRLYAAGPGMLGSVAPCLRGWRADDFTSCFTISQQRWCMTTDVGALPGSWFAWHQPPLAQPRQQNKRSAVHNRRHIVMTGAGLCTRQRAWSLLTPANRCSTSLLARHGR